MIDEVLIYFTTNMQNNFMLFSDLQKRLTPSPIKSWRLLKQLRDEGRMREIDDWMMQDRKLFVNVPRFIVELEQLGYGNLKSDEISNGSVISNDITQLIEEMKLISSEITERSIQEEMKSTDISADETKPKFEQQEDSLKSTQQNLKSNEINNSNNTSHLKSNEITYVSREIIDAKNEVIDTLKGSLQSKDTDIVQLRTVISELTQQLKTTTQQNAWLTNLLVAPKQESEPMRTAQAREINDDITDFTEADDNKTETKDEQDGTEEAVNQEQSSEEMQSAL